jgi:hypothetical protein
MRTSLAMPARARRAAGPLIALGLVAVLVSCSPGTLPGSPSLLTTGGGGARYNGSITYQRLSGSHTISPTAQSLQLSIVMSPNGQVTANFQTTQNNGSLSGEVDGTLADGFLDATLLVSLRAQAPGGGEIVCEGQGQVFGRFLGLTLTWSASSITYENCPGLVASASLQAEAVSPIPGRSPGRANVTVTIPGGTRVAAGTCTTGTPGYPFTVEIRESAGVDVTFDNTVRTEERVEFEVLRTTVLDTPFTHMSGGSRRGYSVCAAEAGTYQAFFSGVDAGGNRFRIASPVVSLGGRNDF